MRKFDGAVYRLVSQIPRGRVATYGQVAALLGCPRAARAVGASLKRCRPELPWHRVLNHRGGISIRANVSGIITQRIRLGREGVPFRNGRVDMKRYRWAGPRRRVQVEIAALGKL